MLYYGNEKNLIACAGIDTLKHFPVKIEVLKEGINISESGEKTVYWPVYQYENTGDVSATIAENVKKALAIALKKVVAFRNDEEINRINSLLLGGDVAGARMRKDFRAHVTQSIEDENVYTLSISTKIIDNDLSNDKFTCALLRTDVEEVITALERLVQKTLSGKKFEALLEKCYRDLNLTATNTINRTRRVKIEGYYKTVHDTTLDAFERKLNKKDISGLYSAILASDEVIERDRNALLAELKEQKKRNK